MDSGYSSQSPLPLPRAKSPVSAPVGNAAVAGKKPVPLPRKTLLESGGGKKSMDDKKPIENKIKSNGFREDTLTKSYNTLTKSLKNEIKSASDSVQEKSKAVIESTKNVSARLEKSVRGILTRRPSTIVSSSPTAEEVQHKFERCQSLPGEEIFHSISFDSPLNLGDSKPEIINSDSDFEESAPPPSFPPPPLPDESLYDEVQSVKSNNSGGHSYENYTLPTSSSSVQSECGFHCGQVPIIKKLSVFQDSDSDKSLSSETTRSLAEERRSCQRSESWSFYHPVHVEQRPESESYENVVLQDNVKFSSVNNIYSLSPSIVATGSSEQDTITNKSSLNSDEVERPSSGSEEHSVIHSTISRPESTVSSLSVTNDLYNNWDPISRMKEISEANAQQREEQKKLLLPSKSVILEFDPLYENVMYSALEGEGAPKEYVEEFEDICQLPRYSTIESGNESDDEVLASLPIPPERVDSISQLSSSSASVKNIPNDVEYYLYHRTKDKQSGNIEIKPSFPDHSKKNVELISPSVDETDESASILDSQPSESPEREGSPKRRSNLVRWTSMKRAIKAVADGSNWSPGVIRRVSKGSAPSVKTDPEPLKQDLLERPAPDPSSVLIHSGFVFRSPSGGEKPKDFSRRWCKLREGKLIFSAEKDVGNGKDFISLDTISSIQMIRDKKTSNDGEEVYCMEISVFTKARTHLLGSPGTTERIIWMQKILESLTSVFPCKFTADYTRAGWCYLKEGVSGEWMASWILLHKRSLFYSQCNSKLKMIDLRKARCTDLNEGDKNSSCPRATEEGPYILVDTPDLAVYLQVDAARETKSWRQTIRAAAVDNGSNLCDQQLSRNDIPVIVEKCVNFVYAHGLMSEGIYRQSGANSKVTKLLTLFRNDAWAVQLSRQEYTEYDVANVLKRFFKDLPEPVFTSQLHKHLRNTVVLKCPEEEKLSVYRTQLEQLPQVNYVTIRLLLSHLYALHQQRERNFMPIENLAAIWAPTLMHVKNPIAAGEINWSRRESEVIGELIALYPKLFMVDHEEIARERRMQEVLEKFHNSTTQQHPQMAPPAGDLRIWIHVGVKDSSNCVQITVGPQLTAGEACISLCNKLKAPANKLCLMETILDGTLHRPLHHSERVLDSVLRWGYWDDVDCKNNCLVLAHNTLYEEITPLIKQSLPKSGELKFADQKSKSFKTYVFEFSQANLSYYKDKAGAQKLGEWRIEDIIWYFGYESKRNPHMRWAITFISKNNKVKRSKECPFFGCTIAGASREEQLKWVAAMLVGQYPHNELLPPPEPVNLLE
ncbi:rhoGAP_ARAP and RA_ARAPs domain-containing protein RhoGAP15B [Lycorma delicatula]|uniref:rhoGAP_ARAP and RA_ARAPs domain-containing protein RhoGAP15B n=1 Tax=Lycorma delicatula TaxID=130591 RepID=UPI003F515906